MGMRMPYAAEQAEWETLDGNPSDHRANDSIRGTAGMSRTSRMASTWCGHRSASRSTEDEYSEQYATLHAPEQERSLDFSGTLAAIQPERPTASRHASQAMMVLPDACPMPMSKAMPALAQRAVRVSRRLAEIGAMRPMVVIPGRAVSKQDKHSTHQKTMPPVWLLANLLILVVAGIAVLPRILPADAAAGCKWHTIVPGDTLGYLGSANHTNALALARANHIQNPNLIFVGQRLCIPLTDWAQAHTAPKVPAAQQPPRFGSASGVKSFVQLALPYARQAHQQTGWPTSLILAQWGLEQGWRAPGYTGFNWGNVAALPGEPTVNGIAVPGSPAAFTYARTPQDGLRYYVRVAHLSYYAAVAPTASRNGPNAAARALGRSPWDAAHYTDHGDPGSSLLSIMGVYNLYWYDTH